MESESKIGSFQMSTVDMLMHCRAHKRAGQLESRKINQVVATFLTHCTRFWPLYALSLFTVRLSFETCLPGVNEHMYV